MPPLPIFSPCISVLLCVPLCRAVQDAIYSPFLSYSTTTRSLPVRPKTSGEYISSALAGGTT